MKINVEYNLMELLGFLGSQISLDIPGENFLRVRIDVNSSKLMAMNGSKMEILWLYSHCLCLTCHLQIN